MPRRDHEAAGGERPHAWTLAVATLCSDCDCLKTGVSYHDHGHTSNPLLALHTIHVSIVPVVVRVPLGAPAGKVDADEIMLSYADVNERSTSSIFFFFGVY